MGRWGDLECSQKFLENDSSAFGTPSLINVAILKVSSLNLASNCEDFNDKVKRRKSGEMSGDQTNRHPMEIFERLSMVSAVV